MLRNYSIKAKLGILAGVPVVGALLLASLLWIQAQQGAQSAKALGSVEDLAEMSAGLGELVHELQSERALQGLILGHLGRSQDPVSSESEANEHRRLVQARRTELTAHTQKTDAVVARLTAFVRGRSLDALPRRLRSEMETSGKLLQQLPAIRADIDGTTFPIDRRIAYFAELNSHLIGVTAALTELSDDSELLRNISALVSVMQVKERASQEHALLAHVFALDQFPAGTYRDFVTLTTQERVYVNLLRSNALDEHIELYEQSMRRDVMAHALKMRERALTTIDEPLQVDASEWYAAQQEKINALRELETHLTQDVHLAAVAKMQEIRTSINRTVGVSIAVLLCSLSLAVLLSRTIAGSLSALGSAARRVREEEDFSVRAVKRGQDEIGELTDAFNQMLDAIQHRDVELAEYRHGLEEQVEKRTQQLLKRNQAMRMVLDNVQQGLATICPDGTLDLERSAMFDEWFGPVPEPAHFADSLGADDKDVVATLELAWAQVRDGLLPQELTIDQMPRTLSRDGRHFRLSYRPIQQESDATSALLVVNDVTAEIQQLKEQTEQREAIAIFNRVVKDRSGFQSFIEETQRLIDAISVERDARATLMRNIHTVKGNCSLFQIHSVSQVCHEVEDETDTDQFPRPEAVARIRAAWTSFAERVQSLLGETGDDALRLSRAEWAELVDLTRRQAPHRTIKAKLWELQLEPTRDRLNGFAEQAQRTASMLGKPDLKVVVQDNAVRLPSEQWKRFWGNFSHVIRNAVDHGIETPEEREWLGKPPHGTLVLSSSSRDGAVCIEVTDDGAGIAWEAVREKARLRGLPHESEADLQAALFTDGITTRQAATEHSGRGVGMAAVREVIVGMHGYIEISSQAQQGTTFRFCVPKLQSSSRLPVQLPRSV